MALQRTTVPCGRFSVTWKDEASMLQLLGKLSSAKITYQLQELHGDRFLSTAMALCRSALNKHWAGALHRGQIPDEEIAIS